MSFTHSAEKQSSWLRQSLAHDKKPLGVLVGAGCPSAVIVPVTNNPLIPGINGLTTVVAAEIEKGDLAGAYKRMSDHFLGDQGRAPNIEEVLTFVRSLRMVAGKGSVRDLSATELDGLDQRVCEVVARTVSSPLPDDKCAYHRFAIWAGAIRRACPVEVFTTNYDLLLEQALELFRVPYFDGFVGSHRSFFDAHAIDQDGLPARWMRLWKLHGSINWARDASGNVHRSNGNNGNCVIHPSHLKYDESRRMPYIALMDRLREFLRQPNALLVTCGFSFRDQHINEIILEALQGNSTATVFGLFPGALTRYPEAAAMGERRANLSVLAADAAVVGTKKALWTDAGPAAPAIAGSASGGTASGSGGAIAPRFRLGDFNRFGEFLEDLVGSEAVRKHGFDAE